jgi:hypothetical protein
MKATWYESLRRSYRPDEVILLLIAESAPDPAGGDVRFFYAPTLAAADNLFRGVILALYGHRSPRGSAGTSKVEWLERLQSDGVFLIDVVPYPVNKLGKAARSQALRDHAPQAGKRAREMSPRTGRPVPSMRGRSGPSTRSGSGWRWNGTHGRRA